MKTFHCLSAFLSSLDLCASLPGTRRTNGETPEEGGADTDCDGSPLAEDVPEVRTVPAGVAWGTALRQSSVFTPRESSGSGWGWRKAVLLYYIPVVSDPANSESFLSWKEREGRNEERREAASQNCWLRLLSTPVYVLKCHSDTRVISLLLTDVCGYQEAVASVFLST